MAKKRIDRLTLKEHEKQATKKSATPAVLAKAVKNTIKAATEAKASSPVSTYTSNVSKILETAKQAATQKAVSGTKTTTLPATTYSPGSLYGKVVQDYMKQGMAFAAQGPQSRQQIANSLLGYDIGDYNRGDISNLDMDALREMQLRNQYYITQHQNAGTFDSPEFLTNTYISLPSSSFLANEESRLLNELNASKKKDEEAKAENSYRVNTWQKWSDMQNRLGEMTEDNAPWFYAYADYLTNGDLSKPFDMDAYDAAWNEMDDDAYWADMAAKQKQFEGLDWETLTDKSAERTAYESQTPALEAQADMYAKEIARRQTVEELEALARSNPEFDRLSVYNDTYTPVEKGTMEYIFGDDAFINGLDDLARFINSDASWAERQLAAEYSGKVKNYLDNGYWFMTPQQVATFNVLNETDPEKAQEYLDALRAELLASRAAVNQEYTETLSTNRLLSVPMWIGARGAGLMNTFAVLPQAVEALTGRDDPNSSVYDFVNFQQNVGGAQEEWIGEAGGPSLFGKTLWQHIYGGVTGAADNAARIAAFGPTGSLWAAGAQSASGSLQENAARDDMSGTAKLVQALLTGGAEIGTEKIGLDALFDKGKRKAASYIKGVILSELGEETLNYMSEDAIDAAVAFLFDHKADIKSAPEFWQGLGETALNTLISSALMGGGGAITQSIDNRATGRAIQEQGDPEKMLEIAKSMPEGSETRAVAAEIETRVGKGKKLSLRQLGKLTKTMAGELNEEMSKITNGVMEDAIEQRLVEVGSSREAAKKNAPAIRKIAFGEKVTMAERANLLWDDAADKVTKELTTKTGTVENRTTGETKQKKWLQDMRIAQVEASGEVLGKQIDMQRAANTKNVSQTVKDAAAKGAAKVRRGKNGKPTGKPTARKVAFADGNAKGEGEILRFEEQDGELKMVIQTGKGENDVKAVALDSMTEAEGEGVAGLIESVNDINSSLHSVSAEDANALLATYTSVGGDVGTFVENYERAYLSGYSGAGGSNVNLDPRLSQIAKDAGKRQAEKDEQTRKTRASAYKAVENPTAGWLGRVSSNDQVRGRGNAEGLQEALEGLTESQRITAEASIEFGKAVGLNVVLFESDAENIEGIQNGSFDETTHTVYLDVNSGAATGQDVEEQRKSGTLGYAMGRTLSHELTHYLEVAAPEAYAKYSQRVKEALKAKGQDFALLMREKLDKALAEGRKLSYAGAAAEVIADASEYMLQDSKFTNSLDTTVKGKIKAFIQNFAQKLKDIFRNLTGGHKESAALREMKDGVYHYMEGLQDLWDAGFVEILDKGTADQSGDATEMVEEPEATNDVRFSMRDEDLNYASAEDEDFHRDGRIYDYDFLVAQQPISVVTIPSVDTLMGNGRFSRSEVVEAGKGGIPGPANEQGHKKVTNVYTGRSLTITNNSIRHGLNGDKHRLLANAQIGMVIGDVVKNGIPVNGLAPTDGNALQTYAMVTPCITEDGKRMMAVTHVDIQKNEVNSVTFTDIVHSANGRIYKNSEPVSNTIDVEGEGPYHPSRYTISISDLLRDVNMSFKSLLSQDVMEHLGEERPANGVYSAKVLYSTRDLPSEVSVREFISEAGDDVASTIEEKNALQYFRKRLDAYKAATQAVEEAEAALKKVREEATNAANEAESGSKKAAREPYKPEIKEAEKNVRLARFEQKKAYEGLVAIEQTPHVMRVMEWTKQFIQEALSGSEAEIIKRQKQAEQELLELERQFDEMRAAGRIQMNAEQKRTWELKNRYAKAFKSKVAEGIKERRAEYEAREQKARAYRRTRDEVDKLRRGISRKVKRLNNLRVRETDNKHVPQELQHVADLVMQTFTDSELGRLAFHEAKLLNLGRTYRLLLQSEKDAAYFWDDDIETDIENLKALSESYTAMRERGAGYPSRLSLEGVELETEILQGVDNIVSNVLNMIDSTNTAFLYSREETFNQFANKAGEKLRAHDDHMVRKGVLGKLQNMMDETIRTGNMTPIYFFEHLQNTELLDVFNEMRRGQALYAKIVAEGKDFVQAAKEKHNYGAWVNDGKLKMKTGQGHVIDLTREEAAEIYAIAKREQANKLYQTEHLLYGGFQYKNIQDKVSEDGKTQQTNKPHQLDKADIARIGEWLTAEQKAYADELVGFLSTTMADYGNAASMDMYGYKKFTESYYIPFHTVADQRFQKGDEGPQGENAGTGRVKNSGFTKKLQHKANQPLLVGGLTDTVADHIHKMAAYSAMVQPIENMKRLLNHKVLEPDGTTNTIRALIGQKYGKASQDYLTQLLKDANGATMSDHRAAALTDKLVGAFKRGAVMASASVVLQQPTAAARAMAYISPKYFTQNPFYRPSKGTWDEMMKYSGTAVIKDMGKFDVGMGLTASQYIADENINMFEAYQRLKADSKTKAGKAAYDRFMAWLTAAPGKADQWTWGLIWKAVKAEQAALHPEMDVNSEAFLNMCGARFDDVIDHTQVYDSVLTRSNLMRSTNALHKMATSFMSEPTLSLNMLYDALTGKHNGKQRAGIIGSVVASQVLAGALAALVQAWNDDDDKRNWAEKYADRATGNILDNLNPLGMIPYISDIVSLFEGYDVERPDMSVIADIYDYSKTFFKAFEDGGTPSWKQIENFAGTLANLVGIPGKNISREIRRTRNAILNTEWSAPSGFGVGQAVLGNIPGYGVSKKDYYQRIVTALVRGETEQAEDYKTYLLASKAVDADSLTQGIRDAYKDAYKKGGIDKEQAIDFLLDNDLVTGDEEDERKKSAFQYVDKWGEGTTNYSAYNTLKDAYKAINFSEIQKAWKELTNNGYTDEQVKTQSRTLLKELVQDGTLTTGQATQLLRKWCPYKKDSDNADKPKEWIKNKK